MYHYYYYYRGNLLIDYVDRSHDLRPTSLSIPPVVCCYALSLISLSRRLARHACVTPCWSDFAYDSNLQRHRQEAVCTIRTSSYVRSNTSYGNFLQHCLMPPHCLSLEPANGFTFGASIRVTHECCRFGSAKEPIDYLSPDPSHQNRMDCSKNGRQSDDSPSIVIMWWLYWRHPQRPAVD